MPGRLSVWCVPTAVIQYEALRTWRAGDAGEALARLAAAEAQDPWPTVGMAPAYLQAEVAASIGDDIATLAAVERFRRLPPDRIWRAWGYARAQYLAARAYARLGDRDQAQQELARLLKLLAHADPDVQLVKQARELQRELKRK